MRLYTRSECLDHPSPPGFPERPERLTAILEHLGAVPGAQVFDEAPQVSPRELAAEVHDPDYLTRFERAVARGDGLLDTADNPIGAGSWRGAWAALEGTLAATEWVASGPNRRALAVVRPPGHHAERGSAMGFCFLNNAAIAAHALRSRHGSERVAIFDFDVHHGNGTQHIFEQRPDVFYASVHQYPFYPGTGAASERGTGGGAGTTANFPLPAGSDDAVYHRVLVEEVIPTLAAFRPDALVVSAGFDAWRSDPLGGMRVTETGFRDWGTSLGQFAARWTDGSLVAVLEGGYDRGALPRLVEAFLEGLYVGIA